ncbi:EAL domain-containing protein [Oscillibacter sp.]|uniref:EAL domain-containing protein n=1 Tax=Oscillibacter sp. TaxID=1945593 RepID=UPI0033924138
MKLNKTAEPGAVRPVSRFLILPMLGLLALEIALLMGSVIISGVFPQLRENADQMLIQQVENRRDYLETAMVSSWSNLSSLQETINATASDMVENGSLDLDALGPSGSGPGGDELLTGIVPELTSTLYAKRLSGVFVILNTRELPDDFNWEDASFSGICIRDMDPSAPQSMHNADLLLVRAPVAVVRSHLSTNSDWKPQYTFRSGSGRDFFQQPFQIARNAKGSLSAQYCGYWSEQPYRLDGSDTTCISYSQPLKLRDGTVYGVLGVELQTDYLSRQLPAEELYKDAGSYILATCRDGVCKPVLADGVFSDRMPETLTVETRSDGSVSFESDGRKYCAAMKPLRLYSNNAPFSGAEWVLIGAAAEKDLYYFSDYVRTLLTAIALVTILFGALGSAFISRSLADPIKTLADRVAEAQKSHTGIPDLPATGISEIDQFSKAIFSLSRSVMESSTKMLRIIDMASVELGGFEYRDNESMFVTENFFPMLGIKDVDVAGITQQQFGRLLEQLDSNLISRSAKRDSRLYKIKEGDSVRYIRVSIRRDGGCLVGLAENATAATLERLRIEHERDYDLLTGIYNRRAFCRMADDLFLSPEQLGTAALLMIDLDNLKGINDRFGHDSGDQYIRCAGQCFLHAAPTGTLVARQSGDEFFLLFYGYSGQSEIRSKIGQLVDAVRQEFIILPDGLPQYLSISGGVAWYPLDSCGIGELMKYADFAMYQVKHARKNNVIEFDLEQYQQANDSSECRQEFHRILDEGRLTYHFQPIADAHTGKIMAYEALMRVDATTLKGPEQILNIARREGRLNDIERLTWFKSAEIFQNLLDQGQAVPDALLFVNSIASQAMTPRRAEEFHRLFSTLQPRIVTEILESEDMDNACTRAKREAPGFSGMFALDDYGSGYSSEKNLLELAPAFTKIDISIIRSIDASRDRQEIVSNLVAYAHQRNMKVIAEGVETPRELETVIDLGVDLMQGYFLGRPTAILHKEITSEAMELIRGKKSAGEHGFPPKI